MTEASAQKNTAYGVFVQACWAQHKRQYPDELIHKEIEEFNKQCSVWWYNLSEQERDRFQVCFSFQSKYSQNTDLIVRDRLIMSHY